MILDIWLRIVDVMEKEIYCHLLDILKQQGLLLYEKMVYSTAYYTPGVELL